MLILNNDLKICEVDVDDIFEKSKPTIRKLLYGQWFDFLDYEEDCIQECALLFYSQLIHTYEATLGVTIWQYLKVCYKNQISKFLLKQVKTRYAHNYDKLSYKLFAMDYHNWQIESMEFSNLLTAEQKQILSLILQGYEYSEICDIVCPNNKTKDKKRPIYRRVAEIKAKLARFYDFDYIKPDHSGNIKRSEKAYQKQLLAQ